MSLEWACGDDLSPDIFEGPTLSVCISEVFILGTLNISALVGFILYYFAYVRKYHNFEGKSTQSYLITICFIYKICGCIIVAFQWIFSRLAYQYIRDYPNALVFNDLSNMVIWLLVMALFYSEYNRNLPHNALIRIFLILSSGARAFNLVGLYNLTDPEVIKFYYNISVPTTVISVQISVALLLMIGAIPKFQQYIEPSGALPLEKEENGSGVVDLFVLLYQPGTKLALSWLFLGFVFAGVKGYLSQYSNHFDGLLFEAAQNATNFPPGQHLEEILENLKALISLYSGQAACLGVSLFLCGMSTEKIINGRNGVRRKLFNSLMHQEMAYHNSLTSGSISSRFSNDSDRIRKLFTEIFPQFIEHFSLCVFGSIQMFQESWTLTLYLVGIAPLAFGVTYYQSERIEVYTTNGQTQNATMGSKVQDVFSKFTTVLIYGKQDREVESFSNIVKGAYNVFLSKHIFNSVLSVITGILSWGVQPLAFALAINILMSDKNNDKAFVRYSTWVFYSFSVITSLVKIMQIFPQIGESLGACGDLIKMIKRKPESPEIPTPNTLNVTEGVIHFDKVNFSYPGSDRVALKNIDLKINPGTKVAIVGDSGAGKSTILQLIARFYDASKGRVLIDGQDISKCSTTSVRENMAMVSQDSDLFSFTILENILYGLKDPLDGHTQDLVESILRGLRKEGTLEKEERAIVEEVMNVITAANAHDFVKTSKDLTTKLGEGGKGLSGGQKQRITIARALYKDPKILLLDEVTSALDPISEAIIQSALDRLTKDRTVLIVAHRLHTIKNADMIVVMKKGEILASGTHKELKKTSKKYKKMVDAAKETSKENLNTKTAKILEVLRNIKNDVQNDKTPVGRNIQKLLAQITKV